MQESCLLELQSDNSDDRAAACELLAALAALRPTLRRKSSTSHEDRSSSRSSKVLDRDNKLDVPLFINEECSSSNNSSGSSSNLDNQDDSCAKNEADVSTVTSSKASKKKKKESDNIFGQLLSRRRSNASSTSSTKSSKSNVDSGISSSPKRGSLVSSLESSSSGDGKIGVINRGDIMSSSYPSASTPTSLGLGLQSGRPHSSYTSNSTETIGMVSPTVEVSVLTSLNDFIEVLSWVQQRDQSSKVQKAARRGLQQLAAGGAKDVQQWTLSAHGFQGLEVKPVDRNWC